MDHDDRSPVSFFRKLVTRIRALLRPRQPTRIIQAGTPRQTIPRPVAGKREIRQPILQDGGTATVHVFEAGDHRQPETVPYEGKPPGENPKSAPAPLTESQWGAIGTAVGKALAAPDPGSLYARLTPSSAGVSGKGALVFVDPDMVEGGQGYAEFSANQFAPPKGFVVLWIWSPAARSYLVDCAVKGMTFNWSQGFGPRFHVNGPGATLTFDFTNDYSDDGYHLVWQLNVTSPGWTSFALFVSLPEEMLIWWKLHSCDIRHL